MAYSYYTAIDAQASAIGSDESNFPVALTVTDARFGQDGEVAGGHVQNVDVSGGASGSLTVPADFVASPNDDGSSPYDFEVVSYTKTSGQIELWVEVTSLSSSVDTTIYLCYGDSNVTTSQEDVAGTWGNGFEAFWHIGAGSGSTAYDSVADKDGTFKQTDHWTSSGQIGDAYDFDGADDGIDIPEDFNIWASDWTIGGWLKADTLSGKTTFANIQGERNLFLNFGDGVADDVINIRAKMGGEWGNVASHTLSTGSWYYVVATYSTVDGYKLLIDGAQEDSNPSTSVPSSASYNSAIGWTLPGYERVFDGIIDEVFFASAARDSDWIATSYNNQSDPTPSSTFWSALGAEAGQYTLTVDQASILLTSYDVTLTLGGAIGYEIDVDQASINLTGYDVGLKAGITITVDQASIEVTGQDVGLTAEIAISLTWTDNAEHEDGFTIERQADGGAWVEVVSGLAPDTESYEENMVVGHTYNYRVRATSATLGDSEWSKESNITI